MMLGEMEERSRIIWIDRCRGLCEVLECFAHRRGVTDRQRQSESAPVVRRSGIRIACGQGRLAE